MENKNLPDQDREQRSILDRLWNPATTKDEVLLRVFLWASIILFVLLPRLFEGLAENQVWKYVSLAWLALAVFLRFKAHFKR